MAEESIDHQRGDTYSQFIQSFVNWLRTVQHRYSYYRTQQVWYRVWYSTEDEVFNTLLLIILLYSFRFACA